MEHNDDEGDDLPRNHTKVSKATHTFVEMVLALENKGVGCQEEIEQTIDEGHIEGDKEYDGLLEEDPHGT